MKGYLIVLVEAFYIFYVFHILLILAPPPEKIHLDIPNDATYPTQETIVHGLQGKCAQESPPERLKGIEEGAYNQILEYLHLSRNVEQVWGKPT